MRLKRSGITCLLLGALQVASGQPALQFTQEELARQFSSGTNAQRDSALQIVNIIGPKSVAPALRASLIAELKRTNALSRESLVTGRPLENSVDPEYVAELHRVVAELNDPAAIPALAGALGSFTLIRQLAELGEDAAPAVLSVVEDQASHYSEVDDALRILRIMLESRRERPLKAETVARMESVARARLTSFQPSFTTVWYAIDLAVALNEPSLRQIVERLTRSESEVRALGISTERIVGQTGQRAQARLAGEPARPQLSDFSTREATEETVHENDDHETENPRYENSRERSFTRKLGGAQLSSEPREDEKASLPNVRFSESRVTAPVILWTVLSEVGSVLLSVDRT